MLALRAGAAPRTLLRTLRARACSRFAVLRHTCNISVSAMLARAFRWLATARARTRHFAAHRAAAANMPLRHRAYRALQRYQLARVAALPARVRMPARTDATRRTAAILKQRATTTTVGRTSLLCTCSRYSYLFCTPAHLTHIPTHTYSHTRTLHAHTHLSFSTHHHTCTHTRTPPPHTTLHTYTLFAPHYFFTPTFTSQCCV